MQESKECGHTLSSEGKCGGKLEYNHRQTLPPDTQSDTYASFPISTAKPQFSMHLKRPLGCRCPRFQLTHPG